MFAFNGKVIVFPPLIINDTDESIFIEENACILKIIYCMPYEWREPFIDEADTKF